MADSKITDLINYTPPIGTDVLPIVDITTSTTKKITLANLVTYLSSVAQAFTNKTFDTAGSGNIFKINGVGITDKTGTGKVVLDTSPTIATAVLSSPTMTTPALGTPASGILTNATGLPVSTGISGLGSGIGSFLATPTSANLATALTDETGSGAVVFGTNPTIAKPVLNATNPTAQTYTPAGAGTATLDCSLANQHFITMPAGNITIALSNVTNNQPFIVSITQDGTGSRTVTWFTTIRWPGGSAPTLTTTGSKRDTFGFIRTGSNTYDGFIVGQNL